MKTLILIELDTIKDIDPEFVFRALHDCGVSYWDKAEYKLEVVNKKGRYKS